MAKTAAERDLEKAEAWYARWGDPIVHALYKHDEAEVRERLNTAWLQLLKSRLADDYHQVIRYRLAYLEFQIALTFCPSSPSAALLDRPLAILRELPVGDMSGEVQARLTLQLRLLAHRKGLRSLPNKEFDRLFRRIKDALNAELCFYISTWAFEVRRVELLERMLEHLTCHASGYQSDFVWQRTNLMHKLLSGEATRLDAVELVKRIAHPQNWRVVEPDLWPALLKAGLVDAKLEQQLKDKIDSFNGGSAPVPRMQPATRRIGKDYPE